MAYCRFRCGFVITSVQCTRLHRAVSKKLTVRHSSIYGENMSETTSNLSEGTPVAASKGVQPKEPAETQDQRLQKRVEAATGNRALFWTTGVIAAVLSIILTALIYPIPAPARTFVALGVSAGALVVGGLVFLVFLIPAAGSTAQVRTEFHSVRAAYNCVLAGLIGFILIAIGAIAARIILTARGH